MNVSVIIPAYNAVETLEETIKSLQAQTLPHWEAIIIDDGSQDETAALATQLALEDNRLRVITQANSGVSAARNRGIEEAHFDWLLFLDADDWIAPEYLEKMTGALTTDPSLDIIHCGWTFVAPDGTLMGEKYTPDLIDLFPLLSYSSTFIIHSCIVRKALVIAAGGFDRSLAVCEDWDFWQRIARTGSRFGAVKEILAFYRMRPKSLSRNAQQFLTDAMKVLNQGHSADARVLNPAPRYAQGQPQAKLPLFKLSWISWLAGLFIGQQEDARPLLSIVKDDNAPDLGPDVIAKNIFESVLLQNCSRLDQWYILWPKIEKVLLNFLDALESQSQAFKLASQTRKILEILILEKTPILEPVQIGTTYGINLEITEPIADILTSENCDRLYCSLTLEGKN